MTGSMFDVAMFRTGIRLALGRGPLALRRRSAVCGRLETATGDSLFEL